MKSKRAAARIPSPGGEGGRRPDEGERKPSRSANFTDADFFRRIVAERATATAEQYRSADIEQFRGKLLRAALSVPLAASNNPICHLEAIVDIAALCERAAVDLTIPASRIKRKDAKTPGRKAKGARQ